MMAAIKPIRELAGAGFGGARFGKSDFAPKAISSSILLTARAGAAAAPEPETAWLKRIGSALVWIVFPMAWSACFRAVAIGCAMGCEAGCHEDALETVGALTSPVRGFETIGSCIDSSNAASAGSGCGVGSFSVSNNAVDEVTAGPDGGVVKLAGLSAGVAGIGAGLTSLNPALKP